MPSTSASSHKGTHGSRKPARSKKRPSAASKRLKVDHAPEDSQGGVPQNVGLCELERLPLELVAEVLSHASSPRDILALARCSKYFCRTLVNNPGTDFIWKQARARSYPTPIPDPTPNFTEASYAAFLFDKGTCEVSFQLSGDKLLRF